MVFLMETKLDYKRMEKVRRISGYNCGIEVSSSSSKGGLSLAWREDVDVQL